MDSNTKNGFTILIEMLSWKNPLFYVFLAVSLFLHWLLFYKIEEKVVIGLLGRSTYTKVLIICMATSFINIFIFDNDILRSNRGILLKVLVAVGFLLLWIVFIIPAWSYSRYDNEKITSYIRFLPFGYKFSMPKRAIYYNNIEEVKIVSGGDSATTLRAYMKQGGSTELPIGNISNSELKYFYRTLYEECDWLRDGMSKNFANFLVDKEDIVQRQFLRYGLGDLFFPFLILVTLLQWFIIIRYIYQQLF